MGNEPSQSRPGQDDISHWLAELQSRIPNSGNNTEPDKTEDVAVIIDAKHLCVSSRGIKDDTSATVTAFYGGVFNTHEKIVELQNFISH
jgi:GTP cyclohydrolase I